MTEDAGAGGELFDGTCPWCGLNVDAGLEKPAVPFKRRCACGAAAFGSPEGRPAEAVDSMVAYYGISPSPEHHGDIHADRRWMKDFWIEAKDAGRSVEASGPGVEESPAVDGSPPGVVRWTWFKRSLPWEKPAGPMTDEERLEWLVAQGEKAYDRMYDSRSPASEYRDAKEYFEEARLQARELGREAQAEELAKRWEHIKAVFRSQFNF